MSGSDALLMLYPVTLILLVGMFWAISMRQEKFMYGILDRFLSRNFEEFGMTDMIKREVHVDQEESADEEERAVDEYLAGKVTEAERVLELVEDKN